MWTTDMLHVLRSEELVRGVDDTPGHECPRVVEVHPVEHLAQGFALGIGLLAHGEHARVGGPILHLHDGLDDVDGVEHGAHKGTHHRTTDEVAQGLLPEYAFVQRHSAHHFVPESEEHERAGPVTQQNGCQAPVVLPDAVRRQELERFGRVPEAVVVVLVLQEGLNPFERSEHGLRGASHEACEELDCQITCVGEVVNDEAAVATERAEHDGNGDGLLNQRGQATTVKVTEAFAAQLVKGVIGADTVQHLPEHHLVHGERADDVDEGCTPPTHKGAQVVICGRNVLVGAGVTQGDGSHPGTVTSIQDAAIFALQKPQRIYRERVRAALPSRS